MSESDIAVIDNDTYTFGKFNGFTVVYNTSNNYINLSALCRSGNKHLKSWNELKSTKTLLNMMLPTIKINRSSVKGISLDIGNKLVGTYGESRIVIALCLWISFEYYVKCIEFLNMIDKMSFKTEKYEDEYTDICDRISALKLDEKISHDEKLYVITTKDYESDNIYKIGYSSDIDYRISCFNSTRLDPEMFYLVYSCKGGFELEHTVHKKLDDYRIKNELFKVSYGVILKTIEEE